MPIRAYGIKWSRGEIDWPPAEGEPLVLLGRHGESFVNACGQMGLYVLYTGDDLLYLGVARHSLGEQLSSHLDQDRLGAFDRFSWFGFCPVTDTVDDDGTVKLRTVTSLTLGDSKTAMSDVQSLLIRLIRPPGNWRFDPFREADEWLQVKRGDPRPGA